jgi:hypothetical protein
MSQQSLDQIADEPLLHPIDIVCDLLREVGSVAQLMEIHYLMREPGMLEIMRDLGALSNDDRNRLHEYLACHRRGRLRVRELPPSALILELVNQNRIDEGA